MELYDKLEVWGHLVALEMKLLKKKNQLLGTGERCLREEGNWDLITLDKVSFHIKILTKMNEVKGKWKKNSIVTLNVKVWFAFITEVLCCHKRLMALKWGNHFASRTTTLSIQVNAPKVKDASSHCFEFALLSFGFVWCLCVWVVGWFSRFFYMLICCPYDLWV